MNKTQVLVVEDDSPIRNLITTTLKTNNYRYLTAVNGASAISQTASHNPDIILLDLGLPDIDGVEVIKKIRTWTNTPIIVISARTEDADKIEALDAGADDYLTKPFAYDELSARVRALLRRNTEMKNNKLQIADLVMDLSMHTVFRGEKEISLTSREYSLLEYFLRNQGQVLTRSQIADHVWNYEFDYDSNVVDVYVRYLRNKIDKGYDCPLIHTVRGYGYVVKYESEKV